MWYGPTVTIRFWYGSSPKAERSLEFVWLPKTHFGITDLSAQAYLHYAEVWKEFRCFRQQQP